MSGNRTIPSLPSTQLGCYPRFRLLRLAVLSVPDGIKHQPLICLRREKEKTMEQQYSVGLREELPRQRYLNSEDSRSFIGLGFGKLVLIA
jgi:hypothetical protein